MISVLGSISPEFVKKWKEDKFKVVYQPNKYFKVIEVDNGEGDPYYYAQRSGRDSVAFVLYDSSKDTPFGLLKQYNSAYKDFQVKAYTGSLNDKHEVNTGEDLIQYVVEEVDEESHYSVESDKIHYVGKIKTCTVSCDETIHLFLVDVAGATSTKQKPEGEYEKNTETPWVTADDIVGGDDPKAISILVKSKMKGLINV